MTHADVGFHVALEALADPVTRESVGAPAAPAKPAAASAWRPRLEAVDFLRGLVLVIMVLDHARDFFGASGLNPRDVHDPALFLTRWVTHYCAPVFVFLAGMSAFLYGNRGRSRGEVAFFLFTRGLFLVAMEVTLVRLGWTFNLAYDFVLLQVIWALGVSMMALSLLIRLKRGAVAAFGLVLVFGHNLLDGIEAVRFGDQAWIWTLLHQPGMLHPLPDMELFALYPLVPWIGVMALGYALAPVLLLEESRRRRMLVWLGLAVVIGFVLLRATNRYGDPATWSTQDAPLATVLAFINCEKYPPSLLYLGMTLGPALIVLGVFRQAKGFLARALVTIGRVPFLLYVSHIFALHALAMVLAWITIGDAAWLTRGMPILAKPEGYGVGLPTVYLLWLAVVAALYPLCRWFASVKQRRNDRWLSYL